MAGAPAFTISELAARLESPFDGDGELRITGLATTADAVAGDLAFVSAPKYASQWQSCKASAAVVGAGVALEGDGRPRITVRNVEQAMILLLELFAPTSNVLEQGTHASAIVHPSAKIGVGARIGPHVSIGAGSIIGANVTLHPGVRIYANVTIGDRSVLHANVVVRDRCTIGRDVIIHQNTSIGCDGFGYRPSPDGTRLLKMPHIGDVVIEDDVELGANTTVDRAKFGSTVIGAGTKIDNLCQVAHNVRLGRRCVVAAQSGFAGSVVVGDDCLIGGKVAIVEHVVIGSRAQVGGGSGVMNDVPDDGRVLGSPAHEARETLRSWAAIRRLPALLREVSQMQARLGDSTAGNAD